MTLNLSVSKIFKILLPVIVGCSSLAIATPFLVSCSQAQQEKKYDELWIIHKTERYGYMIFNFKKSWGKDPVYIYLGGKENVELYIQKWYQPNIKVIDRTKEFNV